MKGIVLHHLANHLLKCAAIMLSILCWLQINYNKPVQCQVEVPLLFDHIPEGHNVSAPEVITLSLQGTRTALYAFDRTESAVHIDLQHMSPGEHTILASRDKFFLPDSLTVLNYTSCSISIE